MLKILAALMVMSQSVVATDTCVSCEKVFHVKESHPKLQGLEIELENGETMSLVEFLENISEDQVSNEVIIFGGEVPWPKPGKKKKN